MFLGYDAALVARALLSAPWDEGGLSRVRLDKIPHAQVGLDDPFLCVVDRLQARLRGEPEARSDALPDLLGALTRLADPERREQGAFWSRAAPARTGRFGRCDRAPVHGRPSIRQCDRGLVRAAGAPIPIASAQDCAKSLVLPLEIARAPVMKRQALRGMAVFGRLFGRGKISADATGVDPKDRARIIEDLGRLNKLQPGLGDSLVRYVCQGDNDSILLTVQQRAKDMHQAMHGVGWNSEGNWVEGRARLFLAPAVWNPEVIRRYGEALAPVYEQAWPKLTGSARTPLWFRTVLRIYGEAWRNTRGGPGSPRAGRQPAPDWAKTPWTIDQLKSLLGQDEAAILDMAFEQDDGWMSSYTAADSPEQMTGFEAHLRADPARRVKEMQGLGAKGRTHGLKTLARLGLTDGAWFDFAFAQVSDSAKGAREAAALLLRGAAPGAVLQRTRDTWASIRPGQKVELVRVVASLCGDDAHAFFAEALEPEKNETVRAELTRQLGQRALGGARADDREDGAEGFTGVSGAWFAAPPMPELPKDVPVSADLGKLIDAAFAGWRTEEQRHNRENRGQKYFREQQVVSHDTARRFCELVGPGGEAKTLPSDAAALNLFNHWRIGKERAALHAQILAHPDLTLWQLMRTVSRHNYYAGSLAQAVFGKSVVGSALRALLHGDLRLYTEVGVGLKMAPDSSVRFLLQPGYWFVDLDDWRPEQLWPEFSRRFDLFDEALGLAAASSKTELQEMRALDLLGQFPETPKRYVSALLDRAIGDRKLVRQPARDLLAKVEGLDQLLIPLLSHPKSETRAGTANWLADRGEAAALSPLLAAARKEKLPVPKAAMIAAIARLGGDITEFVSPDALLKEAQDGLKKTPAKVLDWFPFDAIPRVGRPDGTPLDPAIVRWWIVLAAKLKETGGNPWFELLLDQLDPADAAKLGLAVMQSWIAYDIAAPSDAEANAYAQQEVDKVLASYQRWQPQTTREQVFAMLRNQKLKAYFNSGNDQKGILALSSRAVGADVVALAKAYFRDHYPRTAQCKALLEALAANPSPVAIQFVLAISKRWRTRGVQELAGQLVAAVADRRGWTSEQLADRTIPTGGFDDAGALELPIGDKVYTARLDAEGRMALFNPEGKAVQNLPASAAGDAAADLKAAKALLSSARKEVKQVFEFQTRRLYEALCVEREWPAQEWSEFLLRHPLMGRLVQRLVWMGLDDGGRRLAAFRPMDDLTLTDAADNPVALDGFARVRLAHSTALDVVEAQAWTTHLKDYAVEPLFDQFGRERLTFDLRLKDVAKIEDRRGWMIEAFKLRGVATKLGYMRGDAQDGGWFHVYQKPFDALGLSAVVEFTGNSLPEENRTSALLSLVFLKMKKGGLRWDDGVPLEKVPPVLLSEAWNDLHAMAAAGTGFDTDWEKKAGW